MPFRGQRSDQAAILEHPEHLSTRRVPEVMAVPKMAIPKDDIPKGRHSKGTGNETCDEGPGLDARVVRSSSALEWETAETGASGPIHAEREASVKWETAPGNC